MMDETAFSIVALKELADITEQIETADEEGVLEVELLDGILTITLEDNRQYVINKHTPSRKIWASSPVSGASYYVYEEKTGGWHSTKDNTSLRSMLAAELKQQAGLIVFC